MISKAGSLDPLEAEVPSLIGNIVWEIETVISFLMGMTLSLKMERDCQVRLSI